MILFGRWAGAGTSISSLAIASGRKLFTLVHIARPAGNQREGNGGAIYDLAARRWDALAARPHQTPAISPSSSRLGSIRSLAVADLEPGPPRSPRCGSSEPQ